VNTRKPRSGIVAVDCPRSANRTGSNQAVCCEFDEGLRASETEQKVLDWWREELNAPESVEGAAMPQGRHTEMVSRGAVQAAEIIEFVEWAIADSS
jgi:hypothetical protein